MDNNKVVPKCITITNEQEEFLCNEKEFKLSRFVQDKLDEFIKFKKEYDKFITGEKAEIIGNVL
jgi:hypothetical protein